MGYSKLWEGLVARVGGGLHVTPGIDRGVVHPDFVVNVRPGGASANSAVADDLAAFDPRTGNRGEGGHMRVPSRDAETVIDDNQAAVASVIFYDGHNAVRGGVNRCAVVRSYVNTRVKRSFTTEGI